MSYCLQVWLIIGQKFSMDFGQFIEIYWKFFFPKSNESEWLTCSSIKCNYIISYLIILTIIFKYPHSFLHTNWYCFESQTSVHCCRNIKTQCCGFYLEKETIIYLVRTLAYPIVAIFEFFKPSVKKKVNDIFSWWRWIQNKIIIFNPQTLWNTSSIINLKLRRCKCILKLYKVFEDNRQCTI